MTQADHQDLLRARQLLEAPGLAIKLADQVGRPVEWGLARLPRKVQAVVADASRRAMTRALEVAIHTMDGSSKEKASNWVHRVAVMGTGAAGGAAGLAGLPLELPISTTLMLRSVADHARAQGEDLSTPEARLNCLAVFALGGKARSDDDAEIGYFAVRTALARAVTEAAEYIAARAASEVAADETAPVLARLVSRLAARFAPQVVDKLAAQAVPIAGAVGGAAINVLFIKHYQDMAWGHFTVRRLERTYGAEVVRAAYDSSS